MEFKMQLSRQIMDNVPEEIIELIFARLPVKCLLRLKCLSKYWSSIISSPRFAQVQYNIGPRTEKLFYIDTSAYDHRLIAYDFNHSVDNDSAYAELSTPFLKSIYSIRPIRVIGSCRGFLLVAQIRCTFETQGRKIIDSMWMWNPTTGFHKLLKRPPVDALDVRWSYTHLIGFGYDPSTKDYLVVVIACSDYKLDFSTRVYILSVRDDVWKETEGKFIKCFKSQMTPKDGDEAVGTYFNSSLHWIASDVILTFNLSLRSFTEIPLPLDLKAVHYYWLKVHGDSLGLFTSGNWENNRYWVCIWVMEEYNNEDSWKIIYYVMASVDDIFGYPRFMPICCTQSGYLFISLSFRFPHVMGKCDGNGNIQEIRYRQYKFQIEMPDVESQAVVYRESLLSL